MPTTTTPPTHTNHLLNLMTIPQGMSTPQIEDRFNQIAQLLFSNFAIQKQSQTYLFKEIEFYYYNDNHRDIITHPRSSEPLYWYINDFGGIDLNFQSLSEKDNTHKNKHQLTPNSNFGGILIRQLISEDGSELLSGPLACANLFRHFNAIGNNSAMPKLIEHNNGMVAFIQQPRLNLLTSKQTTEKKVNNILTQYTQHPEKETLYSDFNTFLSKPYRYIRCNNLLHDIDTNTVYFSPWLKDKKEGHPEFYKELTDLLTSLGIQIKELKSTNDYWARDYMPIQLSKNEFLKYRYYPDYLTKSQNKEDIKTITDSTKVLSGMNIKCRSTNLIIDGGNMVPCGPYIVMTDKVYTENNYPKNSPTFKTILESELGHPVITIPWSMHGNFNDPTTDKYGHSDGFIKWCGSNQILMSNHGEEYPEEALTIKQSLQNKGFKITEMRFKDKVTTPHPNLNWAYINFLQVGKNIIMPKFNIEEDTIAKQYIQTAFPQCNIHQIEMDNIVKEGGALHCLSWNIYLPHSKTFIPVKK